MTNTTGKITALYERLSRDDEFHGESGSIKNQKQFLEAYAKEKEFRRIEHFSDDGYSGTNFDRPMFQAMIDGINAGRIDTVIVKDLSRMGRDYLRVGFYTEVLFQEKDVRFIAVNNGIDSAKQTDNDFAPFLNIMNEWYAKDTSKKIRAVFQAKRKNGQRCGGHVPYGCCIDPEDQNHLIINNDTAKVVQKIFNLACGGYNLSQIAKKLRDEKILTPMAYNQKNLGINQTQDFFDPYCWSTSTLRNIIDRKEYLGHLPENQMKRLMETYNNEQLELQEKITAIEAYQMDIKHKKKDTEAFIKLIHQYKEINTLTNPMLYALIDKVIVQEATGGKGKGRKQQVDIYFNFIGKYDVPKATHMEDFKW